MQQNTSHPVRPFMDLLRELNEGQTHDEMSARLNELVEAVSQQHKQGTLTLTLTLRPAQNSAIAMLIVPDIKMKKPEPEAVGSIMFTTEDYNLVRDNPRQTKLELKPVDETRPELRRAE